jgi:N-acetylglucosamine-6-phosphate deacetylase
MTVFSGARIVARGAVLDAGTLVVDGSLIADVEPRTRPADHRLDGHLIVPGFVDVHVHGVAGLDVLASEDGVERVAAVLPRYGVTSFCPTTVACRPESLARMLTQVAQARRERREGSARVLGAHLESNFINPEYRGAQPLACLRSPADQTARGRDDGAGAFGAGDVLDVIGADTAEIAIVTLAPELDGGLELVRTLTAAGHRVSLGHSAATYAEGLDAIDAGARHATHLFNRMPPFSHREPGLVGAILDRAEVTPELIVDGYHVHPAAARAVLRALGPDRALAITDGTAASGLPEGSVAHLGSERLTVGPHVALLDDGTWAGSKLTMDGALRNLVNVFGCSLPDAVRLVAANPARALGAHEAGTLEPGTAADFLVLDADLRIVQTYIDGVLAFDARAAASGVRGVV